MTAPRCNLAPAVREEIEHYKSVCNDELGTAADHDDDGLADYHALAYAYQCLLDGDLATAALCPLLADELDDKATYAPTDALERSLRRLARRIEQVAA